MSFNTFESTFLIANVDWLWAVHRSGDFQYKLDVVLLAPALYSLCADLAQVRLEFVICVCTCVSWVLTHSVSWKDECIISNYFTLFYPRRCGS